MNRFGIETRYVLAIVSGVLFLGWLAVASRSFDDDGVVEPFHTWALWLLLTNAVWLCGLGAYALWLRRRNRKR